MGLIALVFSNEFVKKLEEMGNAVNGELGSEEGRGGGDGCGPKATREEEEAEETLTIAI